MAAIDEATLVGRELAERAYYSMRDQGMTGAESTRQFLIEMGKRARQMDAAGESGSAIAAWVEAVAAAYSRRIEELMG